MFWVTPRILLLLAFVGAGAFVGLLVLKGQQAPWIGGLLGSLTGAIVVFGVDAMRAGRLVHWLGGAIEGPAPRDTGAWGEFGYRVERSLRDRERQIFSEQQSLEQFLSAMQASPNGIMLLDSVDQIIWCNTVAGEHFGIEPERDRLQPVTNLVRSPGFVAAMQDPLRSEPLKMRSARGMATLSVLIRPYGDGMRLVLSQDITAREQADTMRRDFVANVSHEIRSPLTVLVGFIETLDTLPLDEAQRRHVLGLMGQQAHRIQMLVADLLTLAQLEGSPRPALDQWASLPRVLSVACTEGLGLSKGRHQIGVMGGEGVELAVSESELISGLSNLVSNAVRYTPDGGQIHISWRMRPDGMGELCVSDTGIGVAREHLNRLAERFYRVDGSRSRDTGGTGLGLSIVKHVAQRHGGELDLRSEVGRGSRFSIVLPANRIRQAEA